MTTITKERLLTIKQWRETYGPGSNVVLPAEEAEELARIALASLEQNVLSGNSPLIPGEVLSAIREVARIRADFDDFDGDRRGIGDCLDEAEQELIVTINKYASQLAAEPIATNDVREQTAVPPIQADVAQAIENLKQKLVECNRYNYCADAVKNVEDACRAAMLQGAGGNSPAIPDGWVACSERMPENIPGCYEYLVFETLNNQVNHDYWNVPDKGDDRFNPFWNYYSQHVTHWMPLPAAPQQEISHALAKGMERYGDAMQELAKKEVK